MHVNYPFVVFFIAEIGLINIKKIKTAPQK